MDTQEKIEILKKIVNDLFEICFKDEFNVDFNLSEDQSEIKIDITGENVSYLIGQHGRNLISIQHLIRQMYINSTEDFDENLRIIVDIDDYKSKRVEKLTQFAAETADKVKSSGKEVVMPSMSSYERFIIHDYVSENYPSLSTSSIGEDPNRKIIISPIPSESID